MTAVAVAAALRILFIGNSLTVANGLPELVAALARASGGPSIEHRTVALPDFSLEDHWATGEAAKAIAEGGWTFVVLQQGPSALPESRILLREYTARFDREARRIGAKTALYMVWPSSLRKSDFEGVKMSYEGAAKSVGGVFLPAGEAWRAAWRRDATLPFYGDDGFHPTPLGSCLAAIVIYAQLAGRSPADLVLPASFGLSADRAALLKAAAADAIGRNRPAKALALR